MRKEWKGVVFDNIPLGVAKGHFGSGDWRWTVIGSLALQPNVDSEKYGPHVQLQVYGLEPPLKEVRTEREGENKWNRVIIFLQPEQLQELFEKCLQKGLVTLYKKLG
jgi:hypothetical protein